MPRSRSFFALASVLTIGLLGFGYYLVRSTGDSAGAGRTAAAPARASEAAEPQELDRLRRHVGRLERQVQAQGHRIQAGETIRIESGASAAAGDSNTPEAKAERERHQREYMAELATAFREETVDAAWSSQKTSAVQAALAADADLRERVRSVECKSQTCRLELTDDGTPRMATAIQSLIAQVGQELPGLIADHVDGPNGRSTVLYMGQLRGLQVSVQ